MKEGDVALVGMPQADGFVKNRPTIILREMPPFGDMLVCGVSTQVHQEVRGFDETILPSNGDFAASGLVRGSLIRLGFLTVIPQNQIIGTIGSISSARHQRLLRTLSEHLVARK